MMAADIWSRLWLLVDQYPWPVAILLVLVLCFLGTVLACALLGLTRAEDDCRPQRPAGLDNHTLAGYQPDGNVIPWTRRVAPPPRKP